MVTNRNRTRFVPHYIASAMLAVASLVGIAAPARAGVPGVDMYIGLGLGQSNVGLNASDLLVSSFDRKDTSWKIFAGARFLSFAGAELEYIDFGKPHGSGIDIQYKGLAAFGMYYLPIPLPVLDVYLKGGLARVDVNPNFAASTKDTKFAYGGGLKFKFGSISLRAEYEKFKASTSKPSLLSVGISKSFL